MASLMVPSFHSAAILAQYHTVPVSTEETPWREILAVEPDIAVLDAGSFLLTKANYCVTRAASDRDLFLLRGTKAVALAILSDRLGTRLLATVAQTVRRQWPRTRILILGQSAMGLEDYLYDEQLHRSFDPRQVLVDLERLYRGMWNKRSNTIDWNGRSAALSSALLPISDPATTITRASTEGRSPRDTPSDANLKVLLSSPHERCQRLLLA